MKDKCEARRHMKYFQCNLFWRLVVLRINGSVYPFGKAGADRNHSKLFPMNIMAFGTDEDMYGLSQLYPGLHLGTDFRV